MTKLQSDCVIKERGNTIVEVREGGGGGINKKQTDWLLTQRNIHYTHTKKQIRSSRHNADKRPS